MLDLADLGVVCECGSKSLAPAGELEPGALVICATCGRPARVALALLPVAWAEVETELAGRPHDLYAMRWHRHKAVESTLTVLRGTGGRFNRSDRAGVAVGVCFVVLALLLVLKAVHS